MKKLFLATMLFGLLSFTATAQRTPQDRLLRFRTEQRFHREMFAPQMQKLRMDRNRLRFRMEQQRFRRHQFLRPRVQRRAILKHRMYGERMFLKRQHFFKGRRVI